MTQTELNEAVKTLEDLGVLEITEDKPEAVEDDLVHIVCNMHHGGKDSPCWKKHIALCGLEATGPVVMDASEDETCPTCWRIANQHKYAIDCERVCPLNVLGGLE